MANVVSKRINIVSIKMVVEAGELLGIKLLDHLIIGDGFPALRSNYPPLVGYGSPALSSEFTNS